MYQEQLSSADAIIRHLFDPRYNNKYIPLQGKYLYLQHYLNRNWQDICGINLAKRCRVEKLVGSELYIRTSNSMLANELYMMQSLFLQKINAYLLGTLIIKKLYFHTGAFFNKQEREQKPQEAVLLKFEYTTCPKCGAKMLKGLTICSVCDRQARNELRHYLAELLRIQPWLTYEDCKAYYKCDKILFTAVKDNLKNYYFEKVRQRYADKKEEILAVLLLTEKKPEELTPALFENALTYLRRDQSVLAFGSGLHGKK